MLFELYSADNSTTIIINNRPTGSNLIMQTIQEVGKTRGATDSASAAIHRVEQRRARTVTGRAVATARRRTNYTTPSTVSGNRAARFNLPGVSGRLSPSSLRGR